MSFSLGTWLAEHSPKGKENFRRRSIWNHRRIRNASAIHGQPRRSGCTPAEPYPPGGRHNLVQHSFEPQGGECLMQSGLSHNNEKENLNNNTQKSVTYVLNLKCYLCPDWALGPTS